MDGMGDVRLVGRHTEMAALEAALTDASASRGGSIAVVAGAGMGKSALLGWLRMRARERGVRVSRGAPLQVPETAAAPLLLCVDDAELVDDAALRRLHALASYAEHLPVLVVFAFRYESLGGRAVLRELVKGASTVVSLQPLTESAVAELVSPAGDAARGIAALVHRLTGGSPFYARELAIEAARRREPVGEDEQGLDELVPSTIIDEVDLRLEKTSRTCRAIAEAVAVVGDGAPVHHVAAVAQVAPAHVLQAAAGLARDGVFAADRRLAFRYPVMAAAVRRSLDPAERSDLHRRALEAMTGEVVPPLVVAGHLRHTAPAGDPDTVTALRTAATSASEQGSHDLACAFLERALLEPPAAAQRGGIVADLGAEQVRAGRFATAARVIREGLGLAATDDEVAQRAVDLAEAVAEGDGDGAAAAVLDDALRRLADDTAAPARLVLSRLFCHRLWEGTVDHAVAARLERLLAPDAASSQVGESRSIVAFHAMVTGGSATTARRLVPSVQGPPDVGDGSAGTAGAFAVLTLIECGDLASAGALLEQAAVGHGPLAPSSSAALAFARASYFERRGAVGSLSEAARRDRSALEGDLRTVGARRRWRIAREVERLTASIHDTSSADVGAVSSPAEVHTTDGHGLLEVPWRARLHLAAGDLPAARRDGDFVKQACERNAIAWTPGFQWRAHDALQLAADGRRAAARELVEEEIRLASAWGSDHAIGTALRAQGLVASGPGSVVTLQVARERFAAAGSMLDLVRTQIDLGRRLCARDQRVEAREPLLAALDLALRLDAGRLATEARAQLRAAGAKPRRGYLVGLEALTSTERQVAQLAEQGLSNREIAQRLFVSIKTVEGHLRQTYTKLAISGRKELASAIHGE